jgi:hypothetical protein
LETDTPIAAPTDSVDTGEASNVAVGDGITEAAESLGQAEVAPERTYVDFDSLGNQYVKIKVNGEESDVPLSELRNGYMRQDAFTRKTQELAARQQQLATAEALAAALERDPQGTLQALQDAYFGGNQPAPSAAPDEFGDYEVEELDPLEQRLAELEQFRQQQQMQAEQQRIDHEIASLHAEHGDFDETELMSFAIQRGIWDLQTAFAAWHYPKMQEQTRRQAEEARALEAKRNLAAIEGGTHRGATTATRAINSMRDAYLAAKQ